MLKSTNLGAIIFLLIFMCGCKDDPVTGDVNVNIENEFRILLWETLEEDERTFSFKVETIKAEYCENTLIDVAPSIVGSDIAFTIHDIPSPDCPAPIFMADADVEVGELDPQMYSLIISLKNVVQNEGTLTAEDDFYELKMKELNGIIVPEKRLYKVPQNTIWGYIASDNTNADSVADGFLNELYDLTDSQEYMDGYYGYFSSENNELTILDHNISKSSIRTFGLAYDGDNDDLINILSTYRSQNAGVDFKIFTAQGAEL